MLVHADAQSAMAAIATALSTTAHGMFNAAMACRRNKHWGRLQHSIASLLPRERCGLGGPAARRGPQSPEAAYSSPARAPRAAAEARSGPDLLLLVLQLGVCGQVLLVDNLADILEMLLRHGCEVRVAAC